MSCEIQFVNHPRHGPCWYGCVFGSHKGLPYLIECRYSAKPEDCPDPDGKPPHDGIYHHIVTTLAHRADRLGVKLEVYPAADIKCAKVVKGPAYQTGAAKFENTIPLGGPGNPVNKSADILKAIDQMQADPVAFLKATGVVIEPWQEELLRKMTKTSKT